MCDNNSMTVCYMCPLVSVIVPVYNTGDTLFETLNSIKKQTYKNIEVILVNDGSDDISTIKSLNKIKDDIKIVNQENRGLPAARNAGIAISNGKYIICLDSDDCINRRYIEKVVRRFKDMDSSEFAVVTSYVQAFGISSEQWEVPEFNLEKLKYSNVISVASAFTKKAWQEVGGYDESFKKGFEDWDFWLSIVEKGYKWSVIKEPLFYYRRKDSSMITDSNRYRTDINDKIFSKHSKIYQHEDIAEVQLNMKRAELNRNNNSRSFASCFKKMLSKNFWKRFSIFR